MAKKSIKTASTRYPGPRTEPIERRSSQPTYHGLFGDRSRVKKAAKKAFKKAAKKR